MERSWSTLVEIQCELLTARPLENTKHYYDATAVQNSN